jgi:hypothetical protein
MDREGPCREYENGDGGQGTGFRIEHAFASEGTDPNRLHDLETRIEDHHPSATRRP